MLEWHVADVKNIANDDQVTLTIAKSFEIYGKEIT